MPWLSVVTVVKDDLEGFKRSMNSFHDQNLSGVELVVVDSSADSSQVQAFLSEFPSQEFRYEWVAAQGIYSAMNHALEMVQGDYIYFLNAGDLFVDHSVIRDLGDLVAENSPTWIVGRVEILEQSGTRVTSSSWDFKAEKKALFARGLFPPHQGTVVRTDVLRSLGGFNEDFIISADYAAALSLSQVHDPLMTDRVIATFCEGGVSTTRWQDSFREFHKARIEIFAPRGLSALSERTRYWKHFANVWFVKKLRTN